MNAIIADAKAGQTIRHAGIEFRIEQRVQVAGNRVRAFVTSEDGPETLLLPPDTVVEVIK